MRTRLRLGLCLGVCALILVVGLALRGMKKPAADDLAYAKVKDVISRDGFDRMQPVFKGQAFARRHDHRKRLFQFVRFLEVTGQGRGGDGLLQETCGQKNKIEQKPTLESLNS